MDKLRVAFTAAFFQPDGTPKLDGYNISPLTSRKGIENVRLEPGSAIPARHLSDIDVLVMSTSEAIGREALPAEGRLALIARAGAGYDNVDVEACNAARVALAIATEA